MDARFTCRRATLGDIEELKRLFTGTIMAVNTADYTVEEAADWASGADVKAKWDKLISRLYFIVAVAESGVIAGFAAIDDSGYLDYLFVHKDFQRQGVASLLLADTEAYARRNGVLTVTSDVSITALPFFRRKGYTVIKAQKARANKLYLTNYKMEKPITVDGGLSTERLVLRRWRDEDAEALYRYAKDPAVGPIAGWQPHTSVEQSLGIIHTVFSSPETYAVVVKGADEPIGCAGIMSVDSMHGSMLGADSAEIGYWIGREHWGNGYATEAVRRLLSRCFMDLGISKVWCVYYEGNVRSRRVMEKCGFKFHHTEKDKPTPLGDRRTEHFMLITREEWEHGVAGAAK